MVISHPQGPGPLGGWGGVSLGGAACGWSHGRVLLPSPLPAAMYSGQKRPSFSRQDR